MQRTSATNGCNDEMPQKICHCHGAPFFCHWCCNKSGVWSSGREGLRSEETHRTPSYLPISTIFHSATMRQSEHKIPIFLSSVEVIPGGKPLETVHHTATVPSAGMLEAKAPPWRVDDGIGNPVARWDRFEHFFYCIYVPSIKPLRHIMDTKFICVG